MDSKIKKALQLKADEISASESVLFEIKNNLKERKNMKKTSFRILIAVAAMCIIGTVGTIGAGKIATISSHSSHLDEIKEFPAQQELKKYIDFTPKYTETLGGYKFLYAIPVDSTASDSDGNKIGDYKEMNFSYDVGKGDLSLSASPRMVEDFENMEKINLDGVDLYYSKLANKFVPPDYVPTEEEEKLVESGELNIGYGSDKIEEKNSQSIFWVEDGIQYTLFEMGTDIQKDELISMAKEVINS